MKLFLRQVPSDSTAEELCGFVEPVVGPRWYTPFRAAGEVSQCQLLTISKSQGESIETHGLVDIEPPHVAEVAIIRLNGRKLRGRVVEVRRWFDRSADNDRRDPSRPQADLPGAQKRRSDRRRAGLKMRFEDVA